MLGLSNVSFGLNPAIRHVLNSVFLHECREAGLDAAIAHTARIIPMHQYDDHVREGHARPLAYDRRHCDGYDPLTELMGLFEGVEAGEIEQEDRSGWTIEERLSHRIIDGARRHRGGPPTRLPWPAARPALFDSSTTSSSRV